MMKKLTLAVILLFVGLTVLFGQNKTADESNIRAGNFGWGMGDVPETWDNMMRERISRFIPDQDILAIRICSTDSFPVALETAFISPFNWIDEVENLGIFEHDPVTGRPKSWRNYVPKDRVVFLRQDKKCRITKDKPADVEFWIVRPTNELPEFVEARSASTIADFQVIVGDNYFNTENKDDGIKRENLTPILYQTALTSVADFMKKKRTAAAVITVPFYGRTPNKTIVNRVLEAQNFLKKNGIGSHRIFVKRISYGNDIPSEEYIDKYPGISVVYEN